MYVAYVRILILMFHMLIFTPLFSLVSFCSLISCIFFFFFKFSSSGLLNMVSLGKREGEKGGEKEMMDRECLYLR